MVKVPCNCALYHQLFKPSSSNFVAYFNRFSSSLMRYAKVHPLQLQVSGSVRTASQHLLATKTITIMLGSVLRHSLSYSAVDLRRSPLVLFLEQWAVKADSLAQTGMQLAAQADKLLSMLPQLHHSEQRHSHLPDSRTLRSLPRLQPPDSRTQRSLPRLQRLGSAVKVLPEVSRLQPHRFTRRLNYFRLRTELNTKPLSLPWVVCR